MDGNIVSNWAAPHVRRRASRARQELSKHVLSALLGCTGSLQSWRFGSRGAPAALNAEAAAMCSRKLDIAIYASKKNSGVAQ
eukprot:2344459-Amphidinium_carterae.1